MNRETIERLTSAMGANKIKYNKQFSTVLQRGFADEARASLFEEIVEDIDKLIRHGVNSDFTKDMKKATEKLTDIAVKLGEDNRRSLTFERLLLEKRECLANVKTSREFKPEYDMCGNVRDYLEAAKEGMHILQEPSNMQTGAETANMKLCKKLIEEIVASLDGIVDVSGMKAADYYNDVVTKIRTWRVKLARSGGLYDASSVELLRDIQRTVQAWSSLCTPSLRHAKIQDLYEIPVDDLTQAIESISIKQNIEMFLNRCEIYAKETATMRDNGASEKLKESRARLADIERNKQDIVSRFKSGALSRDDAEYDLQNLKDQEDYIKYDMERIKADVVSREEIARRRDMIRKIERPVRSCYNIVKNNRLHVYVLFSGVDFARLVGMVNNNVSSGEFAVGIEELQHTLVTKGLITSSGDLNMQKIEEQLALADQLNADQMAEIAPKQEEAQEGSLLDMMLAQESTKEQEDSERSILSNYLN